MPPNQEHSRKKTKRRVGLIGFGLCCGLLAGPPGCASLPRPPGLSLASTPMPTLEGAPCPENPFIIPH